MKSLALWTLRAYKRWVSPALPPSCRYVPTCSEYAIEAVDRYGVVRGGLMAIWRILRCHPFVKGGYDPVKNVWSGHSCSPPALTTGSCLTNGFAKGTEPAVPLKPVKMRALAPEGNTVYSTGSLCDSF